MGTNLGRIYKIVQYYRNGESLSKLLDIFEVAPNEAIQVMEISQTRKSLYVGTDHRIKQIDLAMCNRRYDNCFRCVRDPYCGWDKEANTCRPYELDLLQVSGRKVCSPALSLKQYSDNRYTGCGQRDERYMRLECAEEENCRHLRPERASGLLCENTRGTEERTGHLVPSFQGQGTVSQSN